MSQTSVPKKQSIICQKVFLGCLPTKTSTILLKKYLEQYIKVIKLKVRYKKYGICAGYGNATVKGYKSELKTLYEIRHEFGTRILDIRPFLGKLEYKSIEEELSSRKLFISGLPMSTSTSDLIKIFSIFGIIEKANLGRNSHSSETNLEKNSVISQTTPHQNFRENSNNHTNFGFVIYEEKDSCIKALAHSSIQIHSYNISICTKSNYQRQAEVNRSIIDLKNHLPEKVKMREKHVLSPKKIFSMVLAYRPSIKFGSRDEKTNLQKVLKFSNFVDQNHDFRQNKAKSQYWNMIRFGQFLTY